MCVLSPSIYKYINMHLHLPMFNLFFRPGHSEKLRRQHRAVAAVLLLRRRRVHPGALRPRGPGAPGARSERERSASGWVGSGLRPWRVKGLGVSVFFLGVDLFFCAEGGGLVAFLVWLFACLLVYVFACTVKVGIRLVCFVSRCLSLSVVVFMICVQPCAALVDHFA